MTQARLWAYLLFGAALVAVARLDLGGAVLAALLSYMILDVVYRLVRSRARLGRTSARVASLLIFLAAAGILAGLCATFIKMAVMRLPALADAALPALQKAAADLGVDLGFADLDGLRRVAAARVAENLDQAARAWGGATKSVLQILAAIAAALLFFMAEHSREAEERDFAGALHRELGERVRRFVRGFELVIGAQVVISAINAVLTAVFLVAIDLPYVPFLVLAAFLLGLIPIVGNVMSNVIIVAAALTVSPAKAALSLAYLVFIHTLEHFLNSRIIGGRIDAPMWLTLLAIMAGEVTLGVSGIVLAPALIHYVRGELQDLPAS